MQIRYDGKFCWSRYPRGHASWCDLKVIQSGEPHSWLSDPHQQAVVTFSKAFDNPGTSISSGIEVLVTHVTDLFRLSPSHTIYIEHTPPEHHFAEFGSFSQEDEGMMQLALIVFMSAGPTEGMYQHIQFAGWQETDDLSQPRYRAFSPTWESLTPLALARMVASLDSPVL